MTDKEKMVIKKGDVVEWDCKPDGLPSFACIGRITKLYRTATGGVRCRKTKVAQIEVISHKYFEIYKQGRIHTTIALDKLRPAR